MTSGPYRFVRHPMYLSYILADIGYNLQEWNFVTLLLVLVGWMSLVYRIHAEERVLSQHAEWPAYVVFGALPPFPRYLVKARSPAILPESGPA